MFFSSATLVVLTLVGCRTYSVEAAIITFMPDENVCVQAPFDRNVTYSCEIDEGNVVWQLNDYQLIDRDQFAGVMVQEDQSGDSSRILFRPNGVTFLTESFNASSFNLTCVAVTVEVNVERNSSRNITVYDPSKVPNLQASSNNGVTTVTWDPVDLPVLVNYTVTITNLDNSMMLPEMTTIDTELDVPEDITCDKCEISVTARGGDCTSLPTTITISIPACPPIETKISCTECDQAAIGITFELSSLQSPQFPNLPENTTVTLRNDAGVVTSRLVSEGNKVSFNELNNGDIYRAEVSVDTMKCVQSNTIPSTRALNCSVTYYKSCGCLKCSFTPGTDDFPWGVQFAFNINEKRRTVDLSRSEALRGSVPEQSVAGCDVEVYMQLREGVVDTQRIPTDVIVADNEDEFLCKVEDCAIDDDDDDICGTVCIIIVIVVGVLCLILGTLLGALLGYCLYKSYSCKDGKKRVSTELSEKTGKLFDD